MAPGFGVAHATPLGAPGVHGSAPGGVFAVAGRRGAAVVTAMLPRVHHKAFGSRSARRLVRPCPSAWRLRELLPPRVRSDRRTALRWLMAALGRQRRRPTSPTSPGPNSGRSLRWSTTLAYF